MRLKSEREVEITRRKLQSLEQLLEESETNKEEDEYVRELSAISVKRLINQLKEEIVRYEARCGVRK